jgi:hypothetical protein
MRPGTCSPPATAEQRYQAALTISEELGDQVNTAKVLTHFGRLRTKQGRFADAMRFQVQSVAIQAKFGRVAADDVRLLRQQRAAIGGRI